MGKERYFTPSNVTAGARAMLRLVARHRNERAPSFEPSASALLVIDMQRYFTDKRSHAFLPSAPAIIEPVKQLIALFQRNGRPVIITRHVNTRKNAGILDRWWSDIITPDSPLSAVAPELAPAASGRGVMLITKTQYDAFFRTGLLMILRKKRIRQLVIAGVMTHLCCETTARSAFTNGFEVFFMADATATQNEDFHAASLRNLAHGFATCALTAEIVKAFKPQNKVKRGR